MKSAGAHIEAIPCDDVCFPGPGFQNICFSVFEKVRPGLPSLVLPSFTHAPLLGAQRRARLTYFIFELIQHAIFHVFLLGYCIAYFIAY